MNKLKEILETIVRDPLLHAKWLNTMSYLEYIGFRKIVKSHRAENFTLDDLTHALEEGRHAIRLKKWALKLGGDRCKTYRDDNMISKSEADAYFQTLDRSCFERTADQKMSYHYVTLLVEIRALKVYQIYEETLKRHRLFSLRSLLQEEELHLSNVQAELKRRDPDYEEEFSHFAAVENKLYLRFLSSVECSVEVAYAATN